MEFQLPCEVQSLSRYADRRVRGGNFVPFEENEGEN